MHRAGFAAFKRFDAFGYVTGLIFQHIDDTAGQVGVRAVHHEEIGKARNRNPEIGLCTVASGVIEILSFGTGDLHRREKGSGRKASTIDDGINIVVLPVLGNDSSLGNGLNWRID